MLQQHVPNIGGPACHLWVSPARDIAHAFPAYVERAAHLAANEIEQCADSSQMLKDLEQYVKALTALCPLTSEHPNMSMNEAGTRAGITRALERTPGAQVFNAWLVRVVTGAFYRGVIDATHAGEDRPYGWQHLENALRDIECTRLAPWYTRVWRALWRCA